MFVIMITLGATDSAMTKPVCRFMDRIGLPRWRMAVQGAVLMLIFSSMVAVPVGLLIYAPGKLSHGVIGGLGVLALGIALSILKAKKLLLYSLLEIGFAVFLSGFTMSRIGMELPKTWSDLHWVASGDVVALLASAYAMIRGLDNFKKWVDEKSEHDRKLLEKNIERMQAEHYEKHKEFFDRLPKLKLTDTPHGILVTEEKA
jgi:hypothetical protein